MVRPFTQNSNPSEGNLVVEEVHPNCTKVFYIPSEERLAQSGLDPAKANDYRVKLLLLSGQDDFVTIYPTNTLGGYEAFLKPKYDKIKCITLAGFGYSTPEDSDGVIDLLEALPSGFIKDYDFGLGFLKEYRFIVDTVEELSDCTEIVIGRDASTGIDQEDSTMFAISYKDFENARKSVNRIAERARAAARSVKRATVFNLLAARIGEEQKPIQIGRNSMARLFAQAAKGDELLGEADQEAVLNVLSKNTKAIAETKPEKLSKLQNDIELVTLELLIERYWTMLGQKLKEERWQAFLVHPVNEYLWVWRW